MTVDKECFRQRRRLSFVHLNLRCLFNTQEQMLLKQLDTWVWSSSKCARDTNLGADNIMEICLKQMPQGYKTCFLAVRAPVLKTVSNVFERLISPVLFHCYLHSAAAALRSSSLPHCPSCWGPTGIQWACIINCNYSTTEIVNPRDFLGTPFSLGFHGLTKALVKECILFRYVKTITQICDPTCLFSVTLCISDLKQWLQFHSVIWGSSNFLSFHILAMAGTTFTN